MIWTKRLRKWTLPEVLPNFQFICKDTQIGTDKNRLIRNIVICLRSENVDEVDRHFQVY